MGVIEAFLYKAVRAPAIQYSSDIKEAEKSVRETKDVGMKNRRKKKSMRWSVRPCLYSATRDSEMT